MKNTTIFKTLGLVGVAVLGVLSFVGCGNDNDKELVVWSLMSGPDGEIFHEMVDAYNETDPEMKVRAITVPDYYTKVTAVMNATKDKDVPDLATIHGERIELFVNQGLLDPMTSIFEAQPNINVENYVSQAWDTGDVEGVQYSVPLDVHSSILYYNKDLLDKYAPGVLDKGYITWDDVTEIAEKATPDGVVTYPISHLGWTVQSMVTQLGGTFYDEFGNPTLETPEIRKAAETLRHLEEMGGTQEEGDDLGQLFLSGGAIFWQEGTWTVTSLRDNEDINWGMISTPTFDGDHLSNWTSTHSFALLKKERSEEKLNAIGDFLEFVRVNSDIWAESGQNVASRAVFDSAEYSEYPQSFLVKDSVVQDSLEIYDFPNNGLILGPLGDNLGDIVFGHATVDEGLERAQRTAVDQIANNQDRD